MAPQVVGIDGPLHLVLEVAEVVGRWSGIDAKLGRCGCARVVGTL